MKSNRIKLFFKTAALAMGIAMLSGCGVKFMGDDEFAATSTTEKSSSTTAIVVAGSSSTSASTPFTVSPHTITSALADKVTNPGSLILKTARNGHTATLLTSGTHAGKILIIGGSDSGGNAIATAELWDPSGYGGKGSFKPTGSLITARTSHTATLITSGTHAGKVLIVGGTGPGALTSAELWDPDGNGGNGSFSATGSLATARSSHTATLLTSGTHAGKVLVVGGNTSTAELWNPDGNAGAGSFSATGSLPQSHTGHTATLLTSGTHAGKVLIAAGASGPPSSLAFLWNPDGNAGAGSFSATGSMVLARETHTATLLTSGVHAGKVLVTGGMDINGAAIDSCELWSPDGGSGVGSFSVTSPMSTGRYSHTSNLITSGTHAGKVLVTGGVDNGGTPVTTAELWDPSDGSFTAAGSLNTARYSHTATLLISGENAGKIAVIGGSDSGGLVVSTAELWDPAGNSGVGTFSTDTYSNIARFFHTATLITTGTHAGKVLIVGGANSNGTYLSSAELWDPSGNGGYGSFTAAGSLATARAYHTATLLTSGTHAGKVLIVAGYNSTAGLLTTSELWDPNGSSGAGSFTATGSLTTARDQHTATLITSGTHAGKVLIVAGIGGGGAITSAELWNPAGNAGAGSFAATGSITGARYSHTATLLTSGTHAGEVLIAGGAVGGASIATAQLWNPDGNAGAGSFTATGSMSNTRQAFTATLLTTGPHAGKVAVISGFQTSTIELWDPDGNAGAGSFSSGGSLNTGRSYHTSTLLTSGPQAGKILIAGGQNAGTVKLDSLEIWNPSTSTASNLSETLPDARYMAAACLLLDGRVFIHGGYYSNSKTLDSYATYSQFEPVTVSATGGTTAYSASILSGTGALYWGTTSGIFIPLTQSTSTVRVEDAVGAYDESVITAQ